MRSPFYLALLAVAILPSSASAMSLSFSWAGVPNCSPKPPAFNVTGAPPGTVKLAFNMVDNDKPSYVHGGGTVNSKGGRIPAGSFTYAGPCPPGIPHSYTWTVKALDASGKVLATAKATATFTPRR